MGSTPDQAHYSATYYAAREGWADRQVESEAAVRALGRLPGRRVLDIGCGNGPLFPLLRRRGLLPIGVDTNAQAAQAARSRRLGAAIQVGSAPILPFRSGVFGGIVAQHLIEHLDRPHAALLEWCRVLQPGGKVVVLTPNARHPDPAIFADPDHRTVFTADSLAALLTAAGFSPRSIGGLFPYLGRGRIGRGFSRRLWRVGQAPPWSGRARTLLAVALKAP